MNKETLINAFKRCLNILRDNEGITGDKALRNLSYLLILKLIEPQFDKEIDIDTFDYDFSQYDEDEDEDEEFVSQHKDTLLKMVRFSNLSKIGKDKDKEENLPNIMDCLWKEILAVHPTTKHVFMPQNFFDIQYVSTYKKLIDVIDSMDFSQTEYDVLGNAYEEVIQDIMTGKVLGQFFTQPLIKTMMVELIDPQIYPDGTIDTCCDPTMGTGGFLISYLQYVLKQANEKEIAPDWEFIRNEGLYGKELEPDTYQLAISNILISTGHMFETFEKGDSLRDPITRKFDNILANPPFGIKGLTYDDFQFPIKSEYLPIRTNNCVLLFLQAIIYMLKIEGKGAVVLPNGQELFSRSKVNISLRKYLMKTCDLKEVIYLPSGMFTYTPIKTCVIFFVKKTTSDINIHIHTTEVKFYDYDPLENKKTLLGSVPMEKIESNAYSLNFPDYLDMISLNENENENENYNHNYHEDVMVKTLGEVCEITYGTRITQKNNISGIYPVYGSGRSTFSTNTYNREGFNILVGRFALSLECIRLVNEKLFVNDSGLSVKPKNQILLHKYLGYFLLFNKKKVYSLARGVAQKNLNLQGFKLLKIPIPPIHKQREIIEYCVSNDLRIQQLQNEIHSNKQLANDFLHRNITKHTMQ